MEKRQTGMIATAATALLCGCPGLFALCWGSISALVSFMPNADIDIGGSSDPQSALFAGLGSLCVGILFVAIPVVVGVVMLRRKSEAKPISDESLPPAT